jgi:hypothetical protein
MNWFRWGMDEECFVVHVCTDEVLRCYAIHRRQVGTFDSMIESLLTKGYEERPCPHTIGEPT